MASGMRDISIRQNGSLYSPCRFSSCGKLLRHRIADVQEKWNFVEENYWRIPIFYFFMSPYITTNFKDRSRTYLGALQNFSKVTGIINERFNSILSLWMVG